MRLDQTPAALDRGSNGGGYPRRMRDLEIRLALDEWLRAQVGDDSDAVIRHELGLEEGRRRIDVALLDDSLSGWEIKSDADTLTRLAGQADAYARVFDFVSIVTTERYREKAIARLPEWWGVIVASPGTDSASVELVREPSSNDSVVALSLVQLLWRDEAMAILRDLNAARGLSGKARWYVWNRLVDTVPLDQLKVLVRQRVKERPEWQGGQLPSAGDATSRMTATL